ncbi:MAG: hypothetical protein IT297_03130 [Anaerolineae bacterium]|nr:hypothetical protein [Anaerolineae bacterium]MCZ7553221.1 hypothetical protein [Anaerolineales bacterium]
MSTRRLVSWLTFLAVFAMAARVSVDSDTWWHLRAGQWMIDHRAILQQDLFSYTRLGAPWEYPGWLVEIPMALIFRVFGPGGLNLWAAAMVTLAFGLLWWALTGGAFLKAFVTVLAAAASGIYWAARPYLVTFVLAAAFLLILENEASKPPRAPGVWRRLGWLPLLMVVWANSHGGFIVGFMLLGVYGFAALTAWLLNPARPRLRDSQAFQLGIVGLAMILAVCLNPAGPVMLLYPFKTVSIGALQQYIQEWQPPDFHSAQVQPFIWLLLLTFGAVGASRQRLRLSDFLLTAGFAYLSFMAARNVALFALAAPLALTRHAAPLTEALSRRLGLRPAFGGGTPQTRKLNWVIFGVLALVVALKAAAVLPAEASLVEMRKTLPVEAVNFLRSERPAGRLFNSYNWGAYLMWELPEYPVFIDGRTDLYDDELVDEWLRVIRAEAGWQEVLQRWEVRLALIEPGAPLARELEQAGWVELYRDERAVVYGR